ncbi:spore germination protein KB [Bacillus sp. OV166]|uniref:GerAB/ArcD/ProY family transporter n=1 Tax=Bacillus sp. OV166 TaxID=1882763 RepID=UPI000A2ADE44|nr:endospore germination permease [Bacillus sp. OV166]SMQ87077.1 spore germination protein KB [Bacillus sp. OV166]
MLEKGKISPLQMAIIMYPMVVATGDLLLPRIVAIHAGRDLWISTMIGSVTGFILVYITFKLHERYLGETIIQYSEKIVGRLCGKIFGFFFIFICIYGDGIITRQYAEFVVGSFMPKTPLMVVIASMIFACALAVRGGIEGIARIAQLFIPIILILWVIIILLLLPDMEIKNIFPIMENGMKPVFRGAIPLFGWFNNVVILAMLLPFLSNSDKGMKYGVISLCIVLLTLLALNITTLFIFGGITATFTYPVMSAVRYISIADFLEHIESIVMAIWVAGAFIKISIFYYIIVIGTSQWLGLSNYRPIVFPMGIYIIICSIWVAPNLQEFSHFVGTTYILFNITMVFVFPLLLFIIAFTRKREVST